ncbi:hypothetical protein [Rossellomorea marisflavi]|uniref:hypothetical protein n=1 Tax=Rossellomorea marisflavi TaxID=189381 RepID=UPI0018CC9957|nr:hypothetical protein [Rossellomorea marisflavi]MBV6684666.1 hypothetical protein [Bacillus sp. JRC01]
MNTLINKLVNPNRLIVSFPRNGTVNQGTSNINHNKSLGCFVINTPSSMDLQAYCLHEAGLI